MIAQRTRPWPSRAVARSTRAMVATPHAQASAAGLDMRRRGGNAVDAAIAAYAVLTVVYPASCAIARDAFSIVHVPRTRRTHPYNGSGRTPRAAALSRLPNGVFPQRGALTVTVPGAVRSREDVARAHGTQGLDELLPSYSTRRRCARDAEATRVFLGAGLPQPGDVLRNPELAAIRRGGADAFYEGAIAEQIVRTLSC
jgi:gamma-glutamyltranspeptidase/glutathione hydrolase